MGAPPGFPVHPLATPAIWNKITVMNTFPNVIRLSAFFLLLASSLGFTSPGLAAQKIYGEGLLLAPTQVVFEGRKRSGTTMILNKGDETTTYRITLVPLLKTDPGKDAQEWIRFSPRRASLAPGETQTVRIFLRKPADAPAGEYTARLMVQAIPPAPETKPAAEGETKDLKVNLDVVYGVSIPIHIKHNP